MYLALHASNHLLQRLSWLMDLKLLVLARPELSWERVVEVARSTAFPHLAWYALDAARRLLAAPVPPNWRRPSLFNALFPRFSETLFQWGASVVRASGIRAALRRLSN